jgi:hypothetical protein
MAVTYTSVETRAYIDGFRAGRADKLLGWVSRYVTATRPHEGVYLWHYAIGYKTAQRGETF